MEGKRKQNVLLSIAILILAVLNGYLFFDEPNYDLVRFNRNLFTITDTSAIQSIRLMSGQMDLSMNRQNQWKINGQTNSDQDIRRMFFTLMNRIRIANKPGESVSSAILKNQNRVEVSFGGLVPDFSVVTNQAKTKTYFVTSQDVFEMEVPGYRDFIASIFQLQADQWMDRTMINANWRTIQKISVEYSTSDFDNFEIVFDKQFFTIEGISPLDSNRVVQFLNEFEALIANERISAGRLPNLDSLAKTQPELIIKIEDINSSYPFQFSFYPKLPSTQYQLITNQAGDKYLLEIRRAIKFYRKRSDFSYKVQ